MVCSGSETRRARKRRPARRSGRRAISGSSPIAAGYVGRSLYGSQRRPLELAPQWTGGSNGAVAQQTSWLFTSNVVQPGMLEVLHPIGTNAAAGTNTGATARN